MGRLTDCIKDFSMQIDVDDSDKYILKYVSET